MDSTIITKNFISAVASFLTPDKWTVFDINFTGESVPCSSETVRVYIKLDDNGGYLYGTNGYCGEPQKVISESEFGKLLNTYYTNNDISEKWDFTFNVITELHEYGINVLPSYLNKDKYIKECRFRDRMFEEYGCD